MSFLFFVLCLYACIAAERVHRSDCIDQILFEEKVHLACINQETKGLTSFRRSLEFCDFCRSVDYAACFTWQGESKLAFGRQARNRTEQDLELYRNVLICLDTCCPRSMRRLPDELLGSHSQDRSPWPKNRTHCAVDSFGREYCRSDACINNAGFFIFDGTFGEPLLGFPHLLTGLAYDPNVHHTYDTKNTFDFPRGFEWRSLTAYQMKGDSEEIHYPLYYGFRLPRVYTDEAFPVHVGDVLVVGWHEFDGSNIQHWLQYAFSIFLSRIRYNISGPWSLVIIRDPGRWLESSKWISGMFRLLLGEATRVVDESAVRNVCFENAIFSGWGDIPLSGEVDMYRWRRHLNHAFPLTDQNEKQLNEHNVVISLRKPGWRRYIRNGGELTDYVRQLLRDYYQKNDHTVHAHQDGSFVEQVQLFMNCSIFISFWGAALTNMLFMRPHTTLIPFYLPFWSGDQYVKMAVHSTLNYLPVRLTKEDAVCWRKVEGSPIKGGGQLAYRHDQQSALLASVSKGTWFHYAMNCAYTIPLDKVKESFLQALMIRHNASTVDDGLLNRPQLIDDSAELCDLGLDLDGFQSCKVDVCFDDLGVMHAQGIPGWFSWKKGMYSGVTLEEEIQWVRDGDLTVIIGLPDRVLISHFEFVQHLIGVFSIRRRYNIEFAVQFSRIVLHDPQNWVHKSEWTWQFFLLLIGGMEIPVYRGLKSFCVANAILIGRAEVPISGVHDGWYWGRFLEYRRPWVARKRRFVLLGGVNIDRSAITQRFRQYFFLDEPQPLLLEFNASMSFAEQVALFSNTALLVTRSDSQVFGNLVFLPPQAVVLVVGQNLFLKYGPLIYNLHLRLFSARSDDARDIGDVFDNAFSHAFLYVDPGFRMDKDLEFLPVNLLYPNVEVEYPEHVPSRTLLDDIRNNPNVDFKSVSMLEGLH